MLAFGTALLILAGAAGAGTIKFSGYTWEVRDSGKGGPGPNHWEQTNAWVDAEGLLHLKISHRDGKWYCSEVYMRERLGFGRYQFSITGRVDKFDKNTVLGLFNFPTSDVGPDGTHEIDIEFAQWGHARAPMGNFTVWPVTAGISNKTKAFPCKLKGDDSTHTFTWTSTNIFFQSMQGREDNSANEFAHWMFQPKDTAPHLSQKPMPVHINLWCFKGLAPTDGKEVEVIIRAFKFTPQP